MSLRLGGDEGGQILPPSYGGTAKGRRGAYSYHD